MKPACPLRRQLFKPKRSAIAYSTTHLGEDNECRDVDSVTTNRVGEFGAVRCDRQAGKVCRSVLRVWWRNDLIYVDDLDKSRHSCFIRLCAPSLWEKAVWVMF